MGMGFLSGVMVTQLCELLTITELYTGKGELCGM